MPFFPPNPGREPFPPGHRQRFGPPNRKRRQPRPFYTTPYQQGPTSRFQGLRTVMGHVGKVTNGVNTLRQMGSFLKFFR